VGRSSCRLGVIGCLCAGALALPATAAGAATTSAGWQVDAEHSGYLYGAGVAPPLHQAWADDLDLFETSAAIDNGRVFALAGQPVPGSNVTQMNVDGIDLATGRVAWSQEVDPNANGGYVNVDDGVVLTTVAYLNQEGGDNQEWVQVSGFDESTGTQLWTMTLPGNVWLPSPPIAHDGVLYIDAEGLGGAVYAIDDRTGAQLWSTPEFVGNAPVWANGTLVIAGQCELSYGIDPTNGAIRWQDSNGCDGGGTLMASFDGTRVWGDFANQYDGVFYDPATGAISGSFSGFSPAFGYGEAVQESDGDTRQPTILRALNPATMSTLWTFSEPMNAPPPDVGSEPLLADGSVFAEGPEGQVWAFAPCTGHVTWQGQVDPPPQSGWFEPLNSLAAGDGYLVVPSLDGLTAFKGSGTPASVPDCTGSPTVPMTGSPPGTETAPPAGTSGPPAPPPQAAAVAPASTTTATAKRTFSHQRALWLRRIRCHSRGTRSAATSCIVWIRTSRTGRLLVRLLSGRRVMASSAQTRAHSGNTRVELHLPVGKPRRTLHLVLALVGPAGMRTELSRTIRVG
jgi:outer membrane protein assembly factor BamB